MLVDKRMARGCGKALHSLMFSNSVAPEPLQVAGGGAQRGQPSAACAVATQLWGAVSALCCFVYRCLWGCAPLAIAQPSGAADNCVADIGAVVLLPPDPTSAGDTSSGSAAMQPWHMMLKSLCLSVVRSLTESVQLRKLLPFNAACQCSAAGIHH